MKPKNETERVQRAMDKAGMDAGLYRKFVVLRADGSSDPGGKHEHCEYFVLDWKHDKFTPIALAAYADACEAEFPGLARDIRDRIAALAVEAAQRLLCGDDDAALRGEP